MKIIEKITLIIYATLMLVVSILLCLLIFGWLDFDIMSNFFQLMITGETTSKILLGVSIIFILLSIKCIFFDSNSKEKENIPLETAIKAITSNPARVLCLKGKGHIKEEFDADLCLMTKDLAIDTVIARGQIMVKDGEPVVKGLFE